MKALILSIVLLTLPAIALAQMTVSYDPQYIVIIDETNRTYTITAVTPMPDEVFPLSDYVPMLKRYQELEGHAGTQAESEIILTDPGLTTFYRTHQCVDTTDQLIIPRLGQDCTP